MQKIIKKKLQKALSIVLTAAMVISMTDGIGGLTVHAMETQRYLICGQEENEEHTHTEDCYGVEENTTNDAPKEESTTNIDQEIVADVKTLFEGIISDYFMDRSEENSIETIVDAMDDETLNACTEQYTIAMEAFEALSAEEAESFITENEQLYKAVNEELLEALIRVEQKSNLDMQPYKAPEEPEGVCIDEEHFPDANFRAYVSSRAIDQDQNGYLSGEEINQRKIISLDYPAAADKIKDFTGIGYFTELENFYCDSNLVETLDLSANTKLIQLTCTANQIQSLDISTCINLEEIWCERNKLAEIDVSNNPNLKRFSCGQNELTELNIEQNTELLKLSCGK